MKLILFGSFLIILTIIEVLSVGVLVNDYIFDPLDLITIGMFIAGIWMIIKGIHQRAHI